MSALTSPRVAGALDHPRERREDAADLGDPLPDLGAAGDLADQHAHEIGVGEPGAEEDRGEPPELVGERELRPLDALGLADELLPARAEDRLEHLLLGAEVVVEQAVRDAGLLGDVADPRPVEAVSREDANRRLEQLAAPVSPPLGQGASIIACAAAPQVPLPSRLRRRRLGVSRQTSPAILFRRLLMFVPVSCRAAIASTAISEMMSAYSMSAWPS